MICFICEWYLKMRIGVTNGKIQAEESAEKPKRTIEVFARRKFDFFKTNDE
jgi:hypothetical protein